MEEHHRYKAVTYRLYPNATTTRKLESTLGCCCDLYNMLLEDELAHYTSEGAKRSKFELNGRMTEISNAHPEIRNGAYSTCRQNVTDRVHRAMKGCRPDKTGQLTHVPRFRSRNRYDSFCYESQYGFAFKGDRLHLSKIGDIRFRHDYHPKGEMRTCTVRRDARGKWYAVIVYRIEEGYGRTDLDGRTETGYDLGLRNLVTDSSGEKIGVPDFYKLEKPKIAKIQAKMQKHEPGSPGWEKERVKLATVHQDIRRRRKRFLHRLAHDIVRKNDVIVFEELNVKKMKERPGQGPAVRDRYTEASWGELIRMLRSRAEEAGTELILVDPRNTSRTCSGCGNVKADLQLSERTYQCECCGMVMDRDRNAAINILRKGLNTQTLRSAVNGRPCRPRWKETARGHESHQHVGPLALHSIYPRPSRIIF